MKRVNIRLNRFLLSCLAIVGLLSACDDDSDNVDISNGDILICTSVPNPDGRTGSSYIQLIENMQEAKYDNEAAFPVPFSTQPIIIGDDAYVLPGLGATDEMVKYSRTGENKLFNSGSLYLPEKSSGVNIIKQSETKAYVSLLFLPKILIINPETMEKTGEIDISEYGVDDQDPNASSMIIRDGKLYVALYQMVGGFYQKKERPYVDVLIIDTETNKPIKMITEKLSGFSSPGSPAKAAKNMFMDEKGDIYVTCIGAFGMYQNHKAGILRIKNGTTEFDPDYKFDFTNISIEGEAKKMNYLIEIRYHKDGTAYGMANIPAYQSSTPNYMTDRPCLPVVLDLENETVKSLGIERGNVYNSVGLIGDKVLFGLSTDTDNGYYIYDIAAKKASEKAVISVEGRPFMIGAFD